MITYLLLNGYPSDQVAIPMTIIAVLIAIKMAVSGIKKDLRGDYNG